MWVPVKRDRTSKPPLGTPLRSDGHWSVQGLISWPFCEGSGKTAFSEGGQAVNLSISGAAKFDQNGLTGEFSAQRVYTAMDLSAYSLITLEFIASFPSYANTNGIMFEQRVAGSPNSSFYINPHADAPSTGKFEIFVASPSGFSEYQLENFTRPPVNEFHHYVVIIDKRFPASSGAIKVWVDGNRVTTNSLGAGSRIVAGPFLNQPLDLFSREGKSFFAAGTLRKVSLYRGVAPNPDQISSLSANPWQIYEPETVWIEVGGGEVINLIAAIAANSYSPPVLGSMERSLLASVMSQTITPDAAATLQRDIMVAIHSAATTGIISASTSRAMSAVIGGQSLTPDNVMATLAGLGLVLDTSIESRSIIRTLQSLTKKYTIHSI